jgi:hypothetical protein
MSDDPQNKGFRIENSRAKTLRREGCLKLRIAPACPDDSQAGIADYACFTDVKT